MPARLTTNPVHPDRTLSPPNPGGTQVTVGEGHRSRGDVGAWAKDGQRQRRGLVSIRAREGRTLWDFVFVTYAMGPQPPITPAKAEQRREAGAAVEQGFASTSRSFLFARSISSVGASLGSGDLRGEQLGDGANGLDVTIERLVTVVGHMRSSSATSHAGRRRHGRPMRFAIPSRCQRPRAPGIGRGLALGSRRRSIPLERGWYAPECATARPRSCLRGGASPANARATAPNTHGPRTHGLARPRGGCRAVKQPSSPPCRTTIVASARALSPIARPVQGGKA